MKAVVLGFSVLLAFALYAKADPTITPDQAAQYTGQSVVVKGQVSDVYVSAKGNLFFNFGGKYPNQVFTAYAPPSAASQFSNPYEYQGKTVSFSGKVQIYKGKPEIVLSGPGQITLEP